MPGDKERPSLPKRKGPFHESGLLIIGVEILDPVGVQVQAGGQDVAGGGEDVGPVAGGNRLPRRR